MSVGSIGRYGTSHSPSPCAVMPLLIASWCEPEKAV